MIKLDSDGLQRLIDFVLIGSKRSTDYQLVLRQTGFLQWTLVVKNLPGKLEFVIGKVGF